MGGVGLSDQVAGWTAEAAACWHVGNGHRAESQIVRQPSSGSRPSRPALLGWIDNPGVGPDNGAGSQAGGGDVTSSEDVHNLLASGEKVIGDDPPVAPPP